jgi:hypothetical protein
MRCADAPRHRAMTNGHLEWRWKDQRRSRTHLSAQVTSPTETRRLIPFNYWKRRVESDPFKLVSI